MNLSLQTHENNSKNQTFNKENILHQLKVDQALRLAEKKAGIGNFQEAKQIYIDILSKFPKNKKALKALKEIKIISVKKNQYSKDPPNAVFNPVVSLFNSGKVNLALEHSIRLLESFPNSALLHNFCGAANAALGRFDVAIIGYKNAISIKPDFTDALFNIGVAQKALNKLDEAIISYKAVLAIDPKNSDSWNNLGIIYEEQGFPDKALKSFSKATLLNHKHVNAFFNKANTLRDEGRIKEAISSYKSVLSINPNFVQAYTSLGALHRQQGKIEKAIENYKKALKINPSYPEAHFLLGNAQLEVLNYNEAIDSYRDAIDLKKDYPEAWSNLGDIYAERNYIDEALSAYENAIDLDPESIDILCSLGSARRQNGELDLAIEAFKKAIKLDPERAETYSNYGIVLNDNGQKKEAMECHHFAIARKPDSASLYLNYGVTLDQNGELNKATEIYKKALNLKPGYIQAHANLAFLYLFKGNLKLGLEHRKWRWKSKEGQQKISHLKLPEWDGEQSLKDKRILALGEQGPGDVIMWAPGLEYLKHLGGRVTLQCHEKLIELFKMSFTGIDIKPINKDKNLGIKDFDYYVPMETLFGYFCINEKKRNKTLNFSSPAQLKTDAFLFPKQERVDFWRQRLKKIGKGPFVGISWKSPLMTYSRKKNYTELSDWEPIFSLSNVTFINLQSKAFEDDLLQIKEAYSVDVHNFDDLDHYDDFADVAALCAALDMCVSISTAASTVAGAVGTPTRMLHWRQSSWNNVLFSPPGPNVKIYEKDTWDSWNSCFESIAKEVKNLK